MRNKDLEDWIVQGNDRWVVLRRGQCQLMGHGSPSPSAIGYGHTIEDAIIQALAIEKTREETK